MIAIIIITSVIVFARNTNMPEEPLFSEQEINYKRIESIEVVEYQTNNLVVTENEDFIKQVSATLKNLKSDHLTTSNEVSKEPLYVIHIINNEYYPGGGIGIYKDRIEYKGRNQTMSAEESSILIKLLENEIQEGKL